MTTPEPTPHLTPPAPAPEPAAASGGELRTTPANAPAGLAGGPEADPPPSPASAGGRALRAALRLLPLVLIAAALGWTLAQGYHRLLSLDYLYLSRELLARAVAADPLRAALAYVALYAVVTGLSIPGAALLTVAGGFVFGWAGGAAGAVVGATVGATGLFLAARTSLGAALASRSGPRLDRFRAGFERDAVSYLLFLRLVSLFPFWLVNLALATLGVRLWTFVWTTFLGIIPGTIAYALAGAGLDSVMAAQRRAYDACMAAHSAASAAACQATPGLRDLVTPQTIAAFAALGLVALAPVFLRRWREARASGERTT